MKRQVPLIITFLVGSLLIVSVFSPPMQSMQENSTLFFDIIAVFAFFLGGGNLVRIHLQKLIRRKGDWAFSIVTLAGFSIMLAFGLFKLGNPGGITAQLTESGSYFQTVFDYVINPLSATMYSLLAFFVASASYRAFRAKNREATILLIAAFIVLMGRTPFGTAVTGWIPDPFSVLRIPDMSIWIMSSPNLAGQRAIMIGIGLGVVSMSMRVILGIERTYLGEDKG
jgi:peptidoglycan/LPS O-acetylase OafA/YrhL